MAEKTEYEFYTFCHQCEEHTGFNGEVITVTDGTTGAEGKCPRCDTYITQMIKASTPNPPERAVEIPVS